MEDPKVIIQTTMDALVSKNPNMTEKQKALQQEALEQIYLHGKTLQEAMKLSDEIMNFLYGQAYQLYKGGKYEKAEGYFFLLMKLNPNDARYIKGFAACKLKQKKFKEAIWAYTSFALLDILNPLPYYQIALIYQEIGEQEAAYHSFKTVVELCGDEPAFSIMKERSGLQIKALENLLQPQGVKK